MSNNSTNSQELDFKPYSTGIVDVAFAVPFAVNMVFGVTGNVLVLLVVRRNRTMHTVTNFLLVNLALGDMLVLICNPRWHSFVVTPVHPHGALGNALCVFYTGNAIITIPCAATIFTLVVLAVERYNALVNALRRWRLTPETCPYVLIAIWVLALAISIPDFLNNYFSEKYNKCLYLLSLELATELSFEIIATVTTVGFLPLIFILFCYFHILKGLYVTNTICSEQSAIDDNLAKKKIAKMCLSVTAVFFLCYIPYGIYFVFIAASSREVLIANQYKFEVIKRALEFCFTLSSSLNPIIYAFQSSSYREGFRKVVKWKREISPLNVSAASDPKNRTNSRSGQNAG
ncbi:predicted protein [Nematostella vectensis]|uniref:G-protein coupled receptors family 1 profile domain-containing protein n=1 Tax=Nematostella vectensis TaxID=45351 RepID=A7S495_NEMVE|nr:predicted protein [Nematostella vectensis]|eukprot:XP_001633501.1 predicted protein [Nematostella vectensis]